VGVRKYTLRCAEKTLNSLCWILKISEFAYNFRFDGADGCEYCRLQNLQALFFLFTTVTCDCDWPVPSCHLWDDYSVWAPVLRAQSLVAWQVLISSSSPCFPTPSRIDPSVPRWKRRPTGHLSRRPGRVGERGLRPVVPADRQRAPTDRASVAGGHTTIRDVRPIIHDLRASRSHANYRPFRRLTRCRVTSASDTPRLPAHRLL